MAEPDKKTEVYFVYPPVEDEIKFTSAGLVIIDFETGQVKTRDGAKAEGGVLPQLQGSLRAVHRKSVRSLHLESDKKIRFYTDVMGNKNLIPKQAGDIWETEMQPFSILYLKILTANTKISLIASTSLIGFKPLMSRPPSTVGSGNRDVAASGTALRLSATSIPCKAVDISAKRTNTGIIYVGGSDVSSTNGRWLYPGDSVSLDVVDVNAVYLDAATTGEGVTYLYTV